MPIQDSWPNLSWMIDDMLFLARIFRPSTELADFVCDTDRVTGIR